MKSKENHIPRLISRSPHSRSCLPTASEANQDSECLKHLIFTDISLRGRDFCQLMVDDSRRRFADFVATQLTVATVADGAPAGAAIDSLELQVPPQKVVGVDLRV